MSNPIIPSVPISKLSNLTAANTTDGDYVPIVDTSDLTDGPTGTTKRTTLKELGVSLETTPVVADDTARDEMFPIPRTGQRVQNLGAGQYERYDGSAWGPDIPVNPATNLGYGILATDYKAYFNNVKTFYLSNYRETADGTDWSPAFSRAITAIKSFAPGLYTSSVLQLPPGLIFISEPIVLPRTGSTPANVVALAGDSIRGTRIAGDATFPEFRALIEWDASSSRAWMQRISNISLALPNTLGVMGIAYTPTYSLRRFNKSASITAGSATLTCPGAFSVADVGKIIWIWGAGTSGKIHKTIIKSVTDANTAVMGRAAVTDATDTVIVSYVFGFGGYSTLTDVTTTAGSTTITSASGAFTSSMAGRCVLIDGAGPEGEPLPVTVTAYTNASTMTVRSPAITSVSNTTAVVLTTVPNMTLERLQLDLLNVGIEGNNDFHQIAAYLGGNVAFSNIQNCYVDSTNGSTFKYDYIALLVDEDTTVDYRHPGGDSVGLQFSNVINFVSTPRRGGLIQLFRGRMNSVCVSNMESGNGTKTHPTLELIHSSLCVFDSIQTEVRGEKPTIKLMYSKQCSFTSWGIGAPNAVGSFGVGNGVELWASTDNRFHGGPTQWPGGPGPFSASGAFLLYVDDYSYRNRFENFLLAGTTITNEVRFPSPDNDNYLEAYNPGLGAWQFLGSKVVGALVTGNAKTPVLAGITASAVLDFPSIAAGDAEELTITVTGASAGDAVLLGPPSTLEADLVATGYVSAANTVTVRLSNPTASPIDPASATWRATVVKA